MKVTATLVLISLIRKALQINYCNVNDSVFVFKIELDSKHNSFFIMRPSLANHDSVEDPTSSLKSQADVELSHCLGILDICLVVLSLTYCQDDNGRTVLALLATNKMLASISTNRFIDHIDKTLNISFYSIYSKVRCVSGNTIGSDLRKGMYVSYLSKYYKAKINGLTFDISQSLARDTGLLNVRTVDRILGTDGECTTRSDNIEWTVRCCLSADGSLSIMRAYGVFSSQENRQDMIRFILKFRAIQTQGGEFHSPRSDAVLKLLESSIYFSDLSNVEQFPLDFHTALNHPINLPRLNGFHEDVNPLDIVYLNKSLGISQRLSL
jgi:hypothetical protein